jgi:hypothetical protein
MSAYFCFINLKMQQAKGKTLSQDQKPTDLMKNAGEQWSAMDEKQKLPYFKLSEKDKVRFDKEMADIDKKGYFVNEDGVKSTELRIQKPKFKSSVV